MYVHTLVGSFHWSEVSLRDCQSCCEVSVVPAGRGPWTLSHVVVDKGKEEVGRLVQECWGHSHGDLGLRWVRECGHVICDPVGEWAWWLQHAASAVDFQCHLQK